ncbi:ROK family transcriptional regulator [Saccharothrix violaceirubra]
MRRLNSALVLDAIAGSPGVSRAAIAAQTGLTKVTVSVLVEQLIAADLVAEGDVEARSGPGRRGTALHLSPSGPHGLGVEIGVDRVGTCLVDLAGRVCARWTRSEDNRRLSPETVLSRVADAVRAALARGIEVGGVGVAVPGLVSTDGTVRTAPNLGWREVDVRDGLSSRIGVPVRVGNEANMSALAELWHGYGASDFVHVSGEFGIGAGLVVDGELFRGVGGFGGELGHLSVDPRGPGCPCGSRGCLEQAAGPVELVRRSGARDLADLLSRLSARDRVATAAVHAAARWLGVALADAVNLLNIPTVVLGGIYARLFPRLRDPLMAELGRRVVSARWTPVRVVASTVGADAAMRGAATEAVRTILEDPDTYLTSTLRPRESSARTP